MEENVLLIIGNGFDLNIGFKTSYADFMKSEYFPKQGSSSLCSYLSLVKRRNMGWIDIEKELATYSKGLSKMKMKTKEDKEKWGTDTFRREYEELKDSLKLYLQNETNRAVTVRDNCKAVRVLNQLPNDGKIISFNYTDTIERLKRDYYCSHKGNLLHIHGSLYPPDDIVFGVEDTADIPQEHVFLYKAYSPDKKIREFSQWLSEADKVIFFGYSLGETDRQYFVKYFQSLCKSDEQDMHIVFYYYGQAAYDNLKWQLQMLTSYDLTMLEMYNRIEFIDCSE